MRAGNHHEPGRELLRAVGDERRQPANLLESEERRTRLDFLELCEPADGAHDLDPAAVHAGFDTVDFGEGVVAVLFQPEVAGHGIEVHAERVAQPVGKHLADIQARLIVGEIAGEPERIVVRRGAIVIQPQDDTRQMRIVRPGTAELVVGTTSPGHSAVGPQRRFCNQPRRPSSPITMYSLPSGPNFNTPPL